MAQKDAVVKVNADSKNYVSGIEQAKRALKGFQEQNQSTKAVMSQVTSVLGKYVSAAALVKGAQEAITRVMNGSQTSADKFAEIMRASKTAVDNFFTSLSTGDFTSFANGLDTIYRKAVETQKALDLLGNADISWSYFQGARTADFRDNMTIAKNTTLPMEQRMAAYQSMQSIVDEMNGMVRGYAEVAEDALQKVMTEKTGVAYSKVSKADLEKLLKIDLSGIAGSSTQRAALSSQYAEYQSKVRGLKPVSSYTLNGVQIKQADDQQRYNRELESLNREYQDAILYNEVLVRNSEDWLKNLISLVQRADAARRSMGELNNTLRETGNSLGAKPTPTVPVSPVSPNVSSGTQSRLFDTAGLAAYLSGNAGSVDLSRNSEALHNMFSGYAGALKDWEHRFTIPDDAVSKLQDVNDTSSAAADNMERMSMAMEGMSSAGRSIESIGNAFKNLGDSKAMTVTGDLLNGLGGAIQAYAQLSEAAATAATMQAAFETPTVVGKIAAVAGIVGAFATAASQFKSMFTSFAEGGVVPGRNFTDGITARVSSGEMVINEADQKRLYDSIHSGNLGGGGGQPYVDVEKIYLGLNNYGRRTGRGELVFSRR